MFFHAIYLITYIRLLGCAAITINSRGLYLGSHGTPQSDQVVSDGSKVRRMTGLRLAHSSAILFPAGVTEPAPDKEHTDAAAADRKSVV